MTARPVFQDEINIQKQFYEGMSSKSLVFSDFTETNSSRVTEGLIGVTAGTGATIANTVSTPVTDHPGMWGLVTGQTAAGRVFLISDPFSSYHVGVGGITRFGCWIRTETNLSDGVNRYVIRQGIGSISLPNIINHGIFFEYVDDQNGGRWQAICGDAPGVETSVDTGVTVIADTWYKLEWECNTAGISVEFFIDDISVAIIATNIPLGTGFNMFTNIHIMKLLGTTFRFYWVDAYYIYQEVTR